MAKLLRDIFVSVFDSVPKIVCRPLAGIKSGSLARLSLPRPLPLGLGSYSDSGCGRGYGLRGAGCGCGFRYTELETGSCQFQVSFCRFLCYVIYQFLLSFSN